jgi:hypothetical protein
MPYLTESDQCAIYDAAFRFDLCHARVTTFQTTAMPLQQAPLVGHPTAPTRNPIAYPAFPEEVAQASAEARKAMRWPTIVTAGVVLLGLTATLAGLIVLRPAAAAAALLVSGGLLLLRHRRPTRSYDSSMGWGYRMGIVAGILGQFLSRSLVEVSSAGDPGPMWRVVEAVGVGGAIGLAVALTSGAAVVVLTIFHVTAHFPPSVSSPHTR